jgi:DNA-binding CsgD family transcriptional regulator
MQHFILLIYVLSFISGASTIILVTLLNFKFKRIVLKKYILILLPMTLLVAIYTFSIYSQVYTKKFKTYPSSIIDLKTIIALLQLFAIIHLPIFIKSLLKFNTSIKKYGFYYISIGIFAISIIADLVFNNNFLVEVRDIILLIVILSEVYLLFVNLKKINEQNLQKYLKIFCYITFSAVIFLFFKIFFKKQLYFYAPLPQSALYFIIYYLIWNVLSILYISRNFFSLSTKPYYQLSKNVLQQYKLTTREAQIIEMIIKGYKSPRIAESLKISYQTVRNHIYNIYQKTDATSKVELINFLNYHK